MDKLEIGERVRVHRCEDEAGDPLLLGGAAGTVVRLRRADDGAWVRLDARQTPLAHPFPEGDARGSDVLTCPAWCSPERAP